MVQDVWQISPIETECDDLSDKLAMTKTSEKLSLRKTLFARSGGFAAIGVFSFFVNLLMLTGPLFMLQIYDRVLGSRSEETLVSLLILVIGLYVLMGVLDYARGRIAARIGAIFQAKLDTPLFRATLSYANPTAVRDLESVQRFMSSPALFALIDIPWTPLFILMIFVFHRWLGWLALAGGILLVALALLNHMVSARPNRNSAQKSAISDRIAGDYQAQGDVIRGLGMEEAAATRWQMVRSEALNAQISSSDVTGGFSTLSKTFRLFLQSAILALGAYLVLQDQMTAGAMIAGSILMGRALAPIEQTIAYWAVTSRARQGWKSLIAYTKTLPETGQRTDLPKPAARLEVQGVSFVPRGGDVPTVRGVSFDLMPGQALGIIGPSAAGKSSLARLLTGIWQPNAGKIRLDGATLDQYGPSLGQHIGYLPQDVTLFDATIAENIARLSVNPDSAAVVDAAKKAGAHEMILKMPDGYDTRLSGEMMRLSGGQRQRIGLARALYGDPVLLVLDEPNANLDAPGSEALNAAIRQFKADGNSVIIMAHRPSGIAECETLLVMQDGMRKAFGPRDEVLEAQVKNHAQVVTAINPAAKS